MNTKLLTLALVAAAASAGTAAASNSATLDVSVTLTPSPCSIDLDRNGEVVLPQVASKDLSATAPTALGKAEIGLNVTCTAATPVALRVVDNQANTVAAAAVGTAFAGATVAQAYGLGTTPKGNIGAYVLALKDGMADSASTSFIASDDGSAWNAASVLQPRNRLTTWSTGGTPLSVTNAQATLEINAAVVGTNDLDLTSAVNASGSATIELFYL